MTGQAVLTGEQAAALLDILTNHGTYAEIEAFKSPGGVTGFGAPFRRETRVPAGPPSRGSRTTTPGGSVPSTPRARTPVSFFWSREERRKERENGDDDVGDNSNNNNGEDSEKANESRSPLLQMLLERIVLPFPGVRELPPDFWGVRVQGLLARFGEAGLSESYDKGAMGTRKTLACVFILSPEGQYLIKLLESINNLIPYRMITQTLRVGNAALMISGMVRLLLTKLSVTSLTNWVGLTANADDGMNLLQRIIWIVLTYDASDFRKSADKIDKAKEGEEDKPPDEILLAIREHIAKSWEEHDAVRKTSLESSKSIITAVLESAGKSPQLISGMSRGQHAQCLAYYSALLSARDRESIINVLCRQPPDLFTQIVKDVIAAFDPLIRSVHARVDLREHLESFQQFLSEFIRASKPRKPESNANTNNGISTNNNGNTNEGPEKMNKDGSKPSAAGDGETRASVEDYVRLLRRNKELLYKWIHAVAKECPDGGRRLT
ncbi:Uncharacterized protein ESCO_004644 [Escovopsis weberi]|uniref:PX-associated domain-containing protein n=1 Tax=Escovopsis weberi TaxID=150374 RepID=A0A0M8N021_ESCWE|nr:Uncharacterized protein ESCO_004644 [Escovopsis weberi]